MDPMEMVRAVSNEYGLEWSNESIISLFSSFIRDRKTKREFEQYVRAVAAEHNEDAEKAWVLDYGGRVTAEQISSFVARKELVCPYCRYDNPEGGPFDVQDDMILQKMSCPECSRSWSFVYELAWVIEDEEEENE